MSDDELLLQQQIEYYRARAAEYDDWVYRRGRYDRGEKHREKWLAELDRVRDALRLANPGGDVLELACGTGLWTKHLLENCDRLVAVDAASEALEVNRRKFNDRRIEYIHADLFNWKPSGRFDFIFFAFWLSHVPVSRFKNFWSMIGGAVKTGGTVFFVDSRFIADSTAVDHEPLGREGRAKRRLNDGREFEIVKVFHEPSRLSADLRALGWFGQVENSGDHFYYGSFRRPAGT